MNPRGPGAEPQGWVVLQCPTRLPPPTAEHRRDTEADTNQRALDPAGTCWMAQQPPSLPLTLAFEAFPVLSGSLPLCLV